MNQGKTLETQPVRVTTESLTSPKELQQKERKWEEEIDHGEQRAGMKKKEKTWESLPVRVTSKTSTRYEERPLSSIGSVNWVEKILAEMKPEKRAQASSYLFQTPTMPKEGRRFIALYEHLLTERGYRNWTESEIEMIDLLRKACHQMAQHYDHASIRMAMANCAENACDGLRCLIEKYASSILYPNGEVLDDNLTW